MASSIFSRMRGWPIVGRLYEVPTEGLKEAREEIASALFWATMPFWFLPLLGALIFAQTFDPFGSFENGELFIYSATLLGPLAYVIHKRYGRFQVPAEDTEDNEVPLSYPFPYGRTFSYLVAVSCILSGVVFSIERMRHIEALRHVEFVNRNGLFWLSILVFLMSNLVLFCVLAYRNMLESLDKKHSDRISRALALDEQVAMDAWIERKDP